MTIWGGGILKNRSILRRILGSQNTRFLPPPKTRIFWGFLGGTPIFGGNTPRIGVKMDPTPPKSGGVGKVKSAR